MALYTYDEEADGLSVLLAPEPEAAIERTLELGGRLHVDRRPDGQPVRVEIFYPSREDEDLESLRDRYALELGLPFRFAP